MGKLLVIGYSEESTIDHFTDYLKTKKVAHDMLDLSKLMNLEAFEVHQGINEFTIKWGDEVFDFTDYDAFYCRYYVTETDNKKVSEYLLELITAITGHLEYREDAVIVNKPSAGGSNGNKFIHTQLLESCGFQVPATYLVGSQKTAKRRIEESGALVSKSNSGIKTESVLLDESLKGRIHLIDNCPTCFQEMKEGTDVRVHMVGDEPVALEITTDSEHIDYRFTKTKKIAYKAVKVPKAVQDACKLYCEREGLAFCGFDFKVKNKVWTVLEANPMPGYDYFDDKLDYKISAALVKYLSRVDKKELNKEEKPEAESFVEKSRRPKLKNVI